MKKNLSSLFLWLIIGAFLTGCAGIAYHGKYDSSIPDEEQVVLIIPGDLFKVHLNGSPISTKKSSMFGGMYSNIIKIPAGTHTISADYESTSQTQTSTTTTTTTTTAENLQITFDFKAGRRYRIDTILSSGYASLSVKESDDSFVAGASWSVGGGWVLGMAVSDFDGGYPEGNMGAAISDIQAEILFLDKKTIWGLNILDFGYALGFYPTFGGAHTRVGASADFYFGQGRILPGLGFGGGVVFWLNSESISGKDVWKNNTIPYIRGTFVLRGKSQAKLFADYYFYDQDELWRHFGTGLMFAF